MEIITYANKSFGMFDELVNNPFNVPVTVLGWGTKWNGFKDKYRSVLEHIKDRPGTDIIVFLDGFDTFINKDPKDVLKIFLSMNCKMLVSDEVTKAAGYFFGTCKGTVANSGLYMGYVDYIRGAITSMLNQPCGDDQLLLNRFCRASGNEIVVDTERVIFQNVRSYSNAERVAIFVSYPGMPSATRYLRCVIEYAQGFDTAILIGSSLVCLYAPRKACFAQIAIALFYLTQCKHDCYPVNPLLVSAFLVVLYMRYKREYP